MLVSTSGFPETETFVPLISTFRAQAANFGAEPFAEICIPGSIGLKVSPDKLDRHLDLLEKAGWIIGSGSPLPEDLLRRLNTPPLDMDEYLSLSAKYEAWCDKKIQSSGNRPFP
jgi:hypothetical protein